MGADCAHSGGEKIGRALSDVSGRGQRLQQRCVAALFDDEANVRKAPSSGAIPLVFDYRDLALLAILGGVSSIERRPSGPHGMDRVACPSSHSVYTEGHGALLGPIFIETLDAATSF